jgi:hypothetical protein
MRIRIPTETWNVSLLLTHREILGPNQPVIQRGPGYFPGVKRPGREADHSSPPSAEVKNEWSYPSAPLIYLRGTARDFLSLPHYCTADNANLLAFVTEIQLFMNLFYEYLYDHVKIRTGDDFI